MKLKMMKIRILSEISKDGEEEKNDDREGRNESKAEVDDGEENEKEYEIKDDEKTDLICNK